MTTLPKIDRRNALNLWEQDRRRLRRTWLAPKITALWLEFGTTWAGSWDIRGSFDFKLGERTASDMEIWVKRTGVDADFYLFGTFIISGNTFTIPHLIVDPPDFAPFNVEVKLRYNNYSNPPGPFSIVKEVTNKSIAPVLRPAYPDLLRWDWNYPNPYKWNVWMEWPYDLTGMTWRVRDGIAWVLIEDYWGYGTARQFAPDGGGELYFIVGVDGSGNEITACSNLVRPDDAPVPPVFYLVDELVGYWKLDEPEDSTRYDSSGWDWNLSEWSFQEATGSGHVPVGQNNGKLNYAADFGDGSGGKALVSFEPNNWFGGDFTFSCWVNYNSASGFDGQGLISVGGTVQIGIRAYDHAVNFTIPTDDGLGYAQALTPNDSIVEYEWTHLVFVKTATTLRIYINGVEQASAPIAGSILASAAGYFGPSDLMIGINPWGYPLIGCVDETACWVRALTEPEVAALYNNGDGLSRDDF